LPWVDQRMSEPALASASLCGSCGAELAPGALACPLCRHLVHSERLNALATEAREAEGRGNLSGALEAWRQALTLLPPSVAQHARVSEEIARLGSRVPASTLRPASSAPPWVKRLGPIAVGVFALWKLVGIGKVAAVASLFASFLVYWHAWGWAFAAGFLVSLYLHELGHVVALRRAGIPASPPMFIPGLGAYVRMHARPPTPHVDALVGLAGPAAGLLVAAAFYAAARTTGNGLLLAIAHAGALINLFNLIPVWQLDGSRGFGALSQTERFLLVAATGALLAWTGERALWLVLILAALRAFSPRAPEDADVPVLGIFGALLVGLSVLSMLSGGGAT
jgi:Zn-dependent protease